MGHAWGSGPCPLAHSPPPLGAAPSATAGSRSEGGRGGGQADVSLPGGAASLSPGLTAGEINSRWGFKGSSGTLISWAALVTPGGHDSGGEGPRPVANQPAGATTQAACSCVLHLSGPALEQEPRHHGALVAGCPSGVGKSLPHLLC